MTEQREQSEQGISTARRRLLKASAAAPLMASLAPNSALAVSSIACTEKSATLMPDSDAAFRQPAIKHTKKNNGDAELPEVLYQIEGFDFGPTGYFEPDGTRFTPRNNGELNSNYQSESVDLAVMFDLSDPASPQLSGIWPAVPVSETTAPLAASCATSLIPTILDL